MNAAEMTGVFAGDYPQIDISGFNVSPGMAVVQTVGNYPRIVIVMKAWRDADSEMNHLVARVADRPWDALTANYPRGTRYGDTLSFSLDYCETIQLVGFCVNPNDRDDNNFGADPTLHEGVASGALVYRPTH